MAGPIRPNDLPYGAPNGAADWIFDNGSGVFRAKAIDIVNAGRPLASQADAEAGADNDKIITALRVKQAVDAQIKTPLSAGTGGSMVGLTTGETVQAAIINRTPVTLEQFGGSGNSVTDNAPAFAALFAAFPNGGFKLTGKGYYRINSSITPPAGCSNWTIDPNGDMFIYNPAHGFDMIILPATVAGIVFNGLKFYTDTGASGGVEKFLIRNESNDFTAINLWGRNVWSGHYTAGAKVKFQGQTYLNNIKTLSGRGFVINQGSREICELQDAYFEQAPGQDCFAGVEIKSGNAVVLGGSVVRCGVPLLLNPDLGQIIATLSLSRFNGDNSSGQGAWFAGSGAIQRVEGFLRVSSNAGDGLRVTNIPQTAVLQVRAVDNGGRGVYLETFGSQYDAFYEVAAYGNGLSGFEVAPSCQYWSARVNAGDGDGFGPNGQYCAVIGAGSDHFTLDVNGTDTLGTLFNGAGTSATKVVRSRS